MKLIEAMVVSAIDAKKSILDAIERKHKEQRIEKHLQTVRKLDYYSVNRSCQIVADVVGSEVLLKKENGVPVGNIVDSIDINMHELGTLSRCYRYALREKISSAKIDAMAREWKISCSQFFEGRFTGLVYQFELTASNDIFLVFVFAEKEFEQNFKRFVKRAKSEGRIKW
jgi:hypothetical protein